ncbi:MAG: hypothetical protein ACRCTK_02990 [Alphaproteobacteria bacterium]
MRNKILLKLAFIAFSAPQFVLAGSDDRDKNPETSVEVRKIHPPSPGSGELSPTDLRTVGEDLMLLSSLLRGCLQKLSG